MRKLIAGCMLVSLLHAAAADDTLAEILEYLEEHAFYVHIEARMLNQEGEAVWVAESSWPTIEGRAVRIPLSDEGNDIQIIANITPVRTAEDKLMLIAYGELRNREHETTRFTYESFVQSLTVEPGEKVVLVPGVAVDAAGNEYRIELEIQLVPYTEAAERSEPGSTTN